MPGVDGAVKLNSLRAPSTKPETETTVSEFVVQEELEEEFETLEETLEGISEQSVLEPETTLEEQRSVEPEIVIEPETAPERQPVTQTEIIIEPLVESQKPQVKKKSKIDIDALFLSVKDIVFKMYDNVFSKTPSFKPTFEQTMGDMILYLSKKLSLKNADVEFNKHFGITTGSVSEKYSKGYIPYALQLSKWCQDNANLSLSDELLFAVSTIYLESAKLSGVTITELELANDFESEISYAL